MRCECCEREATIHEVLIHHGARRERHLCESCAARAGLSSDPHAAVVHTAPVVIKGSEPTKPSTKTTVEVEAAEKAPSGVRCASCGTTYASFKESGLLGCAACYDAFADRLGPLIERAHEGGCHHVGKFPRRALRECRSLEDRGRMEIILGGVRQREERLETLRRSLEKAIRDEDYERAATLRDELTRVGGLGADAIGPDDPTADDA